MTPRLKRLRYRAWRRGTKEADLLIGGFFDARSGEWDAEQLDWFEALLEEQDVDIMAWAIGTQRPPPRFSGMMIDAMRVVNYVSVAR